MRAWTRLTLGAMMAAALAGSAMPALAYTVDEDIKFASGLIAFEPSFRDFAQTVVDSVRQRDPGSADRLKVIQAELFVKDRKYAEAEKLVQEMGISNPKAQAIMLSLALGYYNAGKSDQAVKLYDDFFNQYQNGNVPTDPDVLRFYQTAAFQYGQIREAMEDFERAADCYKRVQDSTDLKDLQREMQLQQARAWVKVAEYSDGEKRAEALKKCKAICSDIQWGGLDVPFVNSTVILANAMIVEGDAAGARAMLDDYKDQFRTVDDMLEEQGEPLDLSPQGGARSLLGRLYRQEADAVADNPAEAIPLYSKALTEFYNVFVKYGKGPDGPNAGIQAKEIKDILETKYGKTVKIDLPENLQAQAAGTEFGMADSLFKKEDYTAARDEYLKVLAQFPESGDLSIRALAQLLQTYIKLEDPLMAKMVGQYIGERFGRKSDVAGAALRAAAGIYRERGAGEGGAMNEDATRFFDMYIQYCPQHPAVSETLFYLASVAKKAEENDKANAYYNRILADYKNTKEYPKALSVQAWGAYANHDYADAIGGLKLYLKDTDGQASPLRANAMFALADCLRRTAEQAEKEIVAGTAQARELVQAGDRENAQKVALKVRENKVTAEENFKAALQQFQALIKGLSTNIEDYGRREEEKAKNRTLLEQAKFWFAFTLSQKNDPKFQQMAVQQLGKFTEEYPNSAMNPRALKLKGSLQLALKDPAANETFETLAKKYPDTDEGKNAQYARISGALDLNLKDQAEEAAQAMISNPSAYSLEQFARVGELLLEHELWAKATAAYEVVRDRLGELSPERVRAYEERALYGIGKGSFETGKFDEAQDALSKLMEKYPKSGLFFKAKYVLASSAIKRDDTDTAMSALNDILRYATDNETINDASILMAQTQIMQGDQVGALSTYKRLEFLNSLNMKSDREREQIRTALVQAIDLEEAMPDDTSLIETVDRFLEIFPTDARASDFSGKRNRARQRLEEAATGGGDGTAPAES